MALKKSKDTFDPIRSAEVFGALADPTRLRILMMLDIRPRSVNEIVDFFTLAQPTISRHLRVLSRAGLVNIDKQGQRRIYSLNGSILKESFAGYLDRFKKASSSRDKS